MSNGIRYPNESEEYRAARDALLQSEIDLRAQLERVARQRRELPVGGLVEQDYEFRERTPGGDTVPVRLSDLFAPGQRSLLVYSYMYGAGTESPCPACTSLIDGLNGSAPHVTQRASFVVVGRSPIDRLHGVAEARGWNNIRLLSSAANSYNLDYHGENDAGEQMPMMNVFTREEDGVHHFWGTELLFAEVDGHPRHMDLAWPIWSLLDMTPEGRGTDWFPQVLYE